MFRAMQVGTSLFKVTYILFIPCIALNDGKSSTQYSFNMLMSVEDDATLLRRVNEIFLWSSALKFAIVTFQDPLCPTRQGQIFDTFSGYITTAGIVTDWRNAIKGFAIFQRQHLVAII